MSAAVPAQNSAPVIYGPRGEVISQNTLRRARVLGQGGFQQNSFYDSGDIYSAEMAEWRPYLWSPDNALNPNRDRIVSRVRDMVANDGWASGAVTRVLDNAIGANFRPMSKPAHRWLKHETGNKAFDATWAQDYARWAEARFAAWSNDPGKWCDIERDLTFSGMCYLGFRHKIVDGDALAMMRWEPKRMGYGRANYCTAVQVIDPDRLSNPMNMFDTADRRGGVQIDEFGAAIAYHIRQAHQGDWYNAAKSLHWVEVPRETDHGRAIIIHDFEKDRAGQHRGVGLLSPVLKRLKMLVKYDSTELEASIVNAIFGAYLESPFDHSLLQDALGQDDMLLGYQDQRSKFHDERKISLGGVKIPTLFPGEKLDTVAAARPSGNFEGFEAAMLRNVASGMGLSAQQVSQNWGDVNYSSARAALLEAWKTMDRRRAAFVAGFSHNIWLCALEEFHDTDNPPMPNGGGPDFALARYAYGKARWIGPGRGWVDPVAEREGAWLGMEMGTDTLENVAAENSGEDFEDILDQREYETEAFKKRGLTPPSWTGASPRGAGNTPAQDVAPANASGNGAPKEPTPPKPGKQEQ